MCLFKYLFNLNTINILKFLQNFAVLKDIMDFIFGIMK